MTPTSDRPTFETVTPVLSVDDVPSALEYYRDALGFEVSWTWGDPIIIASVTRDGVEVQLGKRGQRGSEGTSHVYFCMKHIEAYYEQCQDRGAKISCELAKQDYGMKDFDVRDPGGNTLCFGEAVLD